MRDVVVIGAGPSGLNAASKLAERGLDVVVLESKSDIGKHVVCTGIVGREAFREFDLSGDSILIKIKKIKWVSPYESLLIYEHPHAFAYVVDREKFDKNLGKMARSNGVEIKLNHHVMDISAEKKYVEILTKREGKYNEKYSTKTAIIATGVNYRLHKRLGLGYPKDFLNGVHAELAIGDIDCTTVFVGNDIARGAFAWVVPVGKDRIRIGLMTEKDPRTSFRNLLERLYLKERKHFNNKRIQFKPIAQGLVSKTFSDRVLAVGEAAGQVKTTTGGGIYFGLVCSDIAAEVMLRRFEEGCFTRRALAEYERLWKKAIKKEILIGYYTRKFCGKLSNARIEKMFQIAQSDGVIPLVREKGDFDWHSELILALLRRMPLFKILRNKA